MIRCRTASLLALAFTVWSVDAGAAVTNAPPDRAAHLKALKSRVPSGFTIVEQAPFFVVGDEAPDVVRARALHTVKWAVDQLKQSFFRKDPAETIDIWLFRDGASYTNHTRSIFGDSPTTPFGYYSSEHNALIMNIGTGGGTLVHEIVHPFMRVNFPACPAWFNEGLASLYEQSSSKNGKIVGLPNWRLPILQRGIRAKETIPFEKLMAMDDDSFYGRGAERSYNQHYPQSRYLCYHLQERGLLERYFREFVAGAKDDPSGAKTLRRVLGEDDLEAFRKKWEAEMLELHYP